MKTVAILALLVISSVAAAAPPNVTYLYPAGARQGTTVDVTAGGTFDRWPVSVWSSVKGVEAKAAKDKGKLTLTIAAEVAPGLCWLRAYNEDGASPLRPFLIGTLPEINEQEPNDDPKKPQTVALPLVVNGVLQKAGDVDLFAVKLTKGQTLFAGLDANRPLGSPMDSVLQILSANGFVLDQNNDEHDLDPQVVFSAPADGTFIVRLFAFPATPDSGIRYAGKEDFVYRLTLTTGAVVDHAFPLAVQRSNPGEVELHGWSIPEPAKKIALKPDDADAVTVTHPQVAGTARVWIEPHACVIEAEPNDRKRPQMIEVPTTVSGRIDTGGDIDVFRFAAKKGQKLSLQVEARSCDSPLDGVLRLTDAMGMQVNRVDDPGGRRSTGRDPELTFTVPQDGSYHIEVSDLHGNGGLRFVYRLRVVVAEPSVELTVATDRFVLTPGKSVDVPVTVTRENGFAEDVEISLEGLPEDVMASPVKSVAKDATGKAVTLKVTGGTQAFSGPIRFVGKGQAARFALAGLAETTADLWLTVLAPPAKPPEKKSP